MDMDKKATKVGKNASMTVHMNAHIRLQQLLLDMRVQISKNELRKSFAERPFIINVIDEFQAHTLKMCVLGKPNHSQVTIQVGAPLGNFDG